MNSTGILNKYRLLPLRIKINRTEYLREQGNDSQSGHTYRGKQIIFYNQKPSTSLSGNGENEKENIKQQRTLQSFLGVQTQKSQYLENENLFS